MHHSALFSFPKRFLACALAVLLLTYAFSFSAIASGGYSSYTAFQSAAENVVCKPISEIQSEDDLAGDIWIGIGSAADLILLSKYTNNTQTVSTISYGTWCSQKYRLTASIYFTEEQSAEFEPIGSGFSKFDTSTYSNKAFEGKFDGCGYVIDGLTCKTRTGTGKTYSKYSYTSLFGLVGESALIQNLVIGRDCTFTADAELANACTASIASRVMAGATLKNLINFAPVSGGTYAGGLVARIDIVNPSKKVAMTNCTNLGTVEGKACAGGLIGSVRSNLQIEDCINEGNVTATANAGGFFGVGDGAASSDVSMVTVMMKNLTQKGSLIQGGTASGNFFGETSNPENFVLTDVSDCSYRSIGLSFTGITNAVELPEGATTPVWEENIDEILTPKFHGLQLGSYADGKLDLRFVGSIAMDIDAYSEIGYLISYKKDEVQTQKRCDCKQVFGYLLAGTGDGMIPYQVEQIRGAEGYLYALTLTGIPLRKGDSMVFTVQSYAKKADGTELPGNSGTVEISVSEDGICSAQWR